MCCRCDHQWTTLFVALAVVTAGIVGGLATSAKYCNGVDARYARFAKFANVAGVALIVFSALVSSADAPVWEQARRPARARLVVVVGIVDSPFPHPPAKGDAAYAACGVGIVPPTPARASKRAARI